MEKEKVIKIGSIVRVKTPDQNEQEERMEDFEVLSIGRPYLTPQDRLSNRMLPRQDFHCKRVKNGNGDSPNSEVVLISIDNIVPKQELEIKP